MLTRSTNDEIEVVVVPHTTYMRDTTQLTQSCSRTTFDNF